MRQVAVKTARVWGKYVQKVRVAFYLQAMNTAYRRSTEYTDLGLPAEAMVLLAEGDRFRAKWLKAQGADKHPAFNSKHNMWVDNLRDGGYEFQ